MAKLNTVNAIPKMTSSTAPSGIVTSSSVYSTYYDYLAFDSDFSNTGWRANGTSNQWLAYEFPKPIAIGKYSLTTLVSLRTPKDWTFEGSNDGTNWTVLDTQINQTGWVNGVVGKREFTINPLNIGLYKKYRLYSTINNGDSSYTDIVELEMFEVLFEKRVVMKNISNQKHYSLDNKTLIHLPSSSDKNMILHGIESGKEIKLDESFDKMKYVKDASEVLGIGKKFTHVVDVSKTKVNKIIL